MTTTLTGTVGRVTGRVAKGTVGEVMLPIAGGVEAFFAHPADKDDVIEKGERVIVMDYEPPRTVTVTRFD